MAYRLAREDGSVKRAVRRIALEQIDNATRAVDASDCAETDAAVHELRKCCKKVRGLLRLVRASFADYDRENAAFRELAETVSVVRDADVLTESYDAVLESCDDHINRRALVSIRRRLTRNRKDQMQGLDIDDLFAQCGLCLQPRSSCDCSADGSRSVPCLAGLQNKKPGR